MFYFSMFTIRYDFGIMHLTYQLPVTTESFNPIIYLLQIYCGFQI